MYFNLYWCFILIPANIHTKLLYSISSLFLCSELETLQITPESINRTPEVIRPDCFELLKVLGKGGYGKVCMCVNICLLLVHVLCTVYMYMYVCVCVHVVLKISYTCTV